MSISPPGDRHPYRGAKMTTDTVVMDVSHDWVTACDVQQRFMQHPDAPIDAVSYSARCRQVRALGGDCYDVLPLSHNRFALGRRGRLRQKPRRCANDIEYPILASDRRLLCGKRRGRRSSRGKFSRTRIVPRRPVRHIILWRFRRSQAHSTLRQCRPQSSHSHSARSLDDSASSHWRASGHFPEFDL